MPRIAGVDLPRNKRMEVALTAIYGIGRTRSKEILEKAGVSLNTRSDNLTEGEVKRIRPPDVIGRCADVYRRNNFLIQAQRGFDKGKKSRGGAGVPDN